MSEKIKVLHMAPLSTGGISKLTVDVNKNIDIEKIRFDYLVFRNRAEFLEEEIKELGSKKQIVDVENVKNPIFRFIKKMYLMIKICKREKYEIVHVDASTPYDIIVAIAAKIAGIKTIIFHSHNDSCKKGNKIRDLLFPICKIIMELCCTDFLAISEQAADFMFPTKILKQKKYRIVKNAIYAEKYLYNKTARNQLRNELGYDESCLVLGNIGRFVFQKNHDFMIDVFFKLYQKHSEARLLLVGEGNLLNEIKQKVSDLGLQNVVCFYGVTHNIPDVLSAMDCFIFPSRFEGLGIVAIEAQASGLPVFCAETIPEEANVSNLYKKISNWDAEKWADEIWDSRNQIERVNHIDDVKNAGYDIKIMAQEMERFYLDKVKVKK